MSAGPVTVPRSVLPPIPRSIQLALSATALAWAAACYAIAGRAASGLAVRLAVAWAEPLLEALFLLFLLVIGLRALDWIATRGEFNAEVLALPGRPTSGREWGVGVALGWGLCLAGLLPVLLTGNLHARITWTRQSVTGIITSLLTLLLVTLAQEVIFRGYAQRRLSAALGKGVASVVLALAFAFTLVQSAPSGKLLQPLVNLTLLGLLLSYAWGRTHALWLGWGVHFAYRAVASVLLGLPFAGHIEFGSVVDSYTGGPRWLSGGDYGVDGALLTAVLLLCGMAVLYRVTRDWAWNYTHRQIVAAGYEVTVAPPQAHTAMERAAAAAPPPLVQILPASAPPRPGSSASG